MSRITPFQQVQRKQKPAVPTAVKNFPEVTVQEPPPSYSTHLPQSHEMMDTVIVPSFDFAAVRRRGNKSFLLQAEVKEAENFPLLLQ